MAQTLMEKWAASFPSGSPDANRTATSRSSDAIRNPLSSRSGLDNNYNSGRPLPVGRKSASISVLWDAFCNVKSDSDASTNMHLTDNFGSLKDLGPYAGDIKKKMKNAMSKNVTVRGTEDAAAFEKRFMAAGPANGGSFKAAFAIADAGPTVFATVKGNYRLGGVNPDGGFSSYTGRPMTNGGEDIATISLQQYRDGMG
jgi:hypothetical protein